MSNLLIHDFDEKLKLRLQEDADQHGRSIDAHVHALLAHALGVELNGNSEDPQGEFDIERIELAFDNSPCPDKRLREHSRVEYGDIKARFSSDASTKRFGLFTRYFACDVFDISVRGARIRTEKQLRDHEAIHLHFISESGEKIQISGLVVRVEAHSAGGFEYGIKFSEVMPRGDLRAVICRKVVAQKFRD